MLCQSLMSAARNCGRFEIAAPVQGFPGKPAGCLGTHLQVREARQSWGWRQAPKRHYNRRPRKVSRKTREFVQAMHKLPGFPRETLRGRRL